ncbi:MAG: hypothetical protein RL033_1705 [Pseudomonadota bacterium]|jgi:carbon monoxide dehydrogenase subunit G
MKLEGTYAFEAPLDTVWQGLFDPEVLARTLPGCDKLERQGDQFLGEINVKMGPVQGKFQGKVDILNVKERESYTMVVDGRGPAGFAKATANIRVKSEGAATRLDYDSDVQVGGKIASVGQRLIDASSRAIVKQSLEGLHGQLKALAARGAAAPAAAAPAVVPELTAQVAGTAAAIPAAAAPAAVAAAAGSPLAAPRLPVAPLPVASQPVALPAAPRGPSQAAFAIGVAKEVTKEMLPRKVVWPVIALLVAAWLLYRFS